MVFSMQSAVHCTVVGDGFVGKSCLVQKIAGGKFHQEYVATLKDSYSTNLSLNGDSFEMNITDIAGEVSKGVFLLVHEVSFLLQNHFICLACTDNTVSFAARRLVLAGGSRHLYRLLQPGGQGFLGQCGRILDPWNPVAWPIRANRSCGYTAGYAETFRLQTYNVRTRAKGC